MNFIIKCDDYILHDSRNQALRVSKPKLTLEVNKNGTLTFDMYLNHPYYNNLKKLQSVITVYRDDIVIFKGRILDDTTDIYKTKKVTVEGIRAYLLDSIYRPFDYQGNIPEFLESIIDNHNSQVQDFQKFNLGRVTVTDPNDYINRSSIDYLSSMEVINTRLIDTHGGYLNVRYEDNGNYIDYLADCEYTATQTIEFAKNITDFSRKIDGASIITGIIPLGAKLQDESGQDTDVRLDITSVNDGKDYLIDEELAAIYGNVFKPIVWDDVTIASNLKSKGQRYLDDNKTFIVNLDITAVDLAATSGDINSFNVGEYVIAKSEIHGVNSTYLLKKLTIDIDNPANTRIQLGTTYNSLSDITINQNNKTDNIIERVDKIETHYVPNTEISGIVNEHIENNSYINQLPDEIMSKVEEQYTKTTDFDQYKEQTSTQLTQTANEINIQFENVTSLIETINGQTQQRFSDIVKYIRFVDGNIILGQVDNPFLLKISNDRISFMENNTEVAYMSNGKLYITDGEFLNTLQLGNFAFSPRLNGNLSFFKNK